MGCRICSHTASPGETTRAGAPEDALEDADAPAFDALHRDGTALRRVWSGEMTDADPGRDPRDARDLDQLWAALDVTPVEWRPEWDQTVNRAGRRRGVFELTP